jgi:hypothetical protein
MVTVVTLVTLYYKETLPYRVVYHFIKPPKDLLYLCTLVCLACFLCRLRGYISHPVTLESRFWFLFL